MSAMTTLADRLRGGEETCGIDQCRDKRAAAGCICAEAADRLDELEAKLARLEAKREVQLHSIAHGQKPYWYRGEEGCLDIPFIPGEHLDD